MSAVIQLQDRSWVVVTPILASQALLQLDLEPESYLLLRAGVLIDPGDTLQDGDQLSLVPVFAGG